MLHQEMLWEARVSHNIQTKQAHLQGFNRNRTVRKSCGGEKLVPIHLMISIVIAKIVDAHPVYAFRGSVSLEVVDVDFLNVFLSISVILKVI